MRFMHTMLSTRNRPIQSRPPADRPRPAPTRRNLAQALAALLLRSFGGGSH
jgi:hypothetical protein